MGSKEFDSILKSAPSATAPKEVAPTIKTLQQTERPIAKSPEMTRIVAVVPQELKDQVREYVKNNKGMSESSLVIKALKALGFKVSSEFEIDRRTTR